MRIVYADAPIKLEIPKVLQISKECDILPETARLLFSRGVNSVDKAKKFLNPSIVNFYDAFAFSDMQMAVDRIKRAKKLNQSVLIFGDYDADGVCATSVLYFCLKDFGITARMVVPEREEGYGLNLETIKRLNGEQKIHLLITVDCGISDKEKIEEIKKLGIDVIVTDHHEAPEVLPNCLIINPKTPCQDYPFDGLCGTGVAYKLGYALISYRANNYLDYVALATVADSMVLTDENRAIVSEGLKIINQTPRYVFKCLLNDFKKKTTAQTLSFQVVARINASGRMGDAKTALLALTETDPEKIKALCDKLIEYNTSRQIACDEVYRQARVKIKEQKLYQDEIILVESEEWQSGLTGIVATRLIEDFGKPIIVFAESGELFKGSARSVEGINVYDILSSANDLYVTFGGHSQAAGLSIKKQNFETLRQRLNAYMKEQGVSAQKGKRLYVEWEITDKITERFAREVDALEPFGVGNPKPYFTVTTQNSVLAENKKQLTPYYRFEVNGAEMIDFDGKYDKDILAMPIKKTILIELSYSIFRNKGYTSAIVKSVFGDCNDYCAFLPYVMLSELRNICGKERELKFITQKEKPQIRFGFGTVYAVSDAKNLRYYDIESGVDVFLFRPPVKYIRNCVVISLNGGADEYDRIVRLDTPITYGTLNIDTPTEIVVSENLPKCNFFSNVTTDRESFSQAYQYLLSLDGKKYKNSAQAYVDYAPPFGLEQFVFFMEVFEELGYMYTYEDERLRIAEIEQPTPLSLSGIYCDVCARNGVYVEEISNEELERLKREFFDGDEEEYITEDEFEQLEPFINDDLTVKNDKTDADE